MKTIKLIIFISSILLVMSINTKDIYFSYISAAYASEKTIKKISDIKSITLIIKIVWLEDDILQGPDMPGGSYRHTIRGIIIFKDENGEECAIDYGGIAELSCAYFHKEFYISPNDFKTVSWFDNDAYAYPIEFKITPKEHPDLGETVKFKIENFEASCSLLQGYRCEGTSLRR